MSQTEGHPAARFEGRVGVIQSRARWAVGALALTALSRLGMSAIGQWQNSLIRALQAGEAVTQETLGQSDTLTSRGAVVSLVLLVVTATLFLRWLHALTRQTGDFGELLGFTPRTATRSFIIPFISLYRPYHIVRDLHDRLDPERLPPPPPVVSADESTGYREVRFTEPPKARRLPHAFIGAWWAAFVAANILGQIAFRMGSTSLDDIYSRNNLSTASDACDVVAAIFCITVVTGLTGRLEERFRRLRHNSPEVLAAEGIDLSTV